MRRGIGAAVGALTVAATAVLSAAGTATADSRHDKAGKDSRHGHLGQPAKAGQVVDLGRSAGVGHLDHPGRHGRGVGTPDDWKHGDRKQVGRETSAPSTAAHNWGGGNWNSKVVFGDMKLD
ncbi:hypothetical protein ADK76_26625 [Streptomyces griseoflavus]|uniref:hypothetical protein n=1 Tax=Streptomyces rimosus TaxID=1927 RepID=UPI0004C4CE6F|nr:hypothetical protein [Streptomyces rimosus]KOG53661.1 hypothetical protein ADK76_26625 [Streptomyces griseoflavus]